ncbi:unnamed protein product [Rhizophagus irregularis]|nr:unnamed protein product [Rhizophagus irregularis]
MNGFVSTCFETGILNGFSTQKSETGFRFVWTEFRRFLAFRAPLGRNFEGTRHSGRFLGRILKVGDFLDDNLDGTSKVYKFLDAS